MLNLLNEGDDVRAGIVELRRTVRHLTVGLVLMGLSLSVIILAGFRGLASPSAPGVVTGTKFVLVDDAGATLATLQTSQAGAEFDLYGNGTLAQLKTVGRSAPTDFGYAMLSLQVNRPWVQGLPTTNFVTNAGIQEIANLDGVHFDLAQVNYKTVPGQGNSPRIFIDAGTTKLGFTTCTDEMSNKCTPIHP